MILNSIKKYVDSTYMIADISSCGCALYVYYSTTILKVARVWADWAILQAKEENSLSWLSNGRLDNFQAGHSALNSKHGKIVH